MADAQRNNTDAGPLEVPLDSFTKFDRMPIDAPVNRA